MKGSVYDFLKRSIKKHGFIQPIVITKEGVIIDGEHRWKALKELGSSQVEVKVLNITEAEAKANTINFNLTKGILDVDALGKLLLELDSEWGKDLLQENLVLEKKQINNAIKNFQRGLSASEGSTCTPSTMDATCTIEKGDTFALGSHTLRCEDSLALSSLNELVNDNEVDMVLTDPPYNVGYKYEGYEDDLTPNEYEGFIKRYVSNALSLSPFVAITPGKVNEHYYYKNFNIIDSAIWYKGFATTHGICSRAMVTEPVLFLGTKPKDKFLNIDYLNYHTDREEGLLNEHSCPKPLDMFRELLTSFTDIGGVVLDIFGGSGTTLIAAELTNRICYMQEIDPKYCQTIIDRWEKYTGRKATKI
jgi:hypothetical protein